MSTSLTHAFVGGTMSVYGDASVSRSKLAIALAALAVVPDIDVLSIPLGLGPDHVFGHRGFTHSLAFAVMVGLLVPKMLFRRIPRFSRDWWTLGGLCFLATASHGILDALTYLAGGIAVWAPFDATRYSFQWRPLPPSPLAVGSIQSYFAPGLILAELSRVWLPAGAIAASFWIARRLRSRPPAHAESLPESSNPGRSGDGTTKSTPNARPAQSVPFGVSLGCIAIVGLCAFLEPESTHELSVASVTYRGVSPTEATALAADVKREMERRHGEVLRPELLRWGLAIDEEPPFQHRVLQNTNDRLVTGRGTVLDDLPVPLEYRFRVRPVAERPAQNDSAGVAVDIETEFKVEDKHATAARLMQDLIRDRTSLLFCHELDKSAARRGVALTLKDWSDDALALLPARIGAR